MPNGDSVAVSDIGDCHLQNDICLRNVLYVSTFQYNLISASKLCRDLNCPFKFGIDSIELHAHFSGKVMVIGKSTAGLYIHVVDVVVQPVEMIVVVVLDDSSTLLWHQRLGHLPFPQFQKLLSLKNTNITFSIVDCRICPLA